MSLPDLPRDLDALIAFPLAYRDLLSLFATSKRYRRLLTDTRFWVAKAHRDLALTNRLREPYLDYNNCSEENFLYVFYDPSLTYEPIKKPYLRYMHLMTEHCSYVAKSSEQFIPLSKCLKYAAIQNNQELVHYFNRQGEDCLRRTPFLIGLIRAKNIAEIKRCVPSVVRSFQRDKVVYELGKAGILDIELLRSFCDDHRHCIFSFLNGLAVSDLLTEEIISTLTQHYPDVEGITLVDYEAYRARGYTKRGDLKGLSTLLTSSASKEVWSAVLSALPRTHPAKVLAVINHIVTALHRNAQQVESLDMSNIFYVLARQGNFVLLQKLAADPLLVNYNLTKLFDGLAYAACTRLQNTNAPSLLEMLKFYRPLLPQSYQCINIFREWRNHYRYEKEAFEYLSNYTPVPDDANENQGSAAKKMMKAILGIMPDTASITAACQTWRNIPLPHVNRYETITLLTRGETPTGDLSAYLDNLLTLSLTGGHKDLAKIYKGVIQHCSLKGIETLIGIAKGKSDKVHQKVLEGLHRVVSVLRDSEGYELILHHMILQGSMDIPTPYAKDFLEIRDSLVNEYVSSYHVH